MTTTKELLAHLNTLRVANGKTELASWKSGREKLEASIANEQVPSFNKVDSGIPGVESYKPNVAMQEKLKAELLDAGIDVDHHAASNELIANAVANDPELAAMVNGEQPAASDLSDVEGQTVKPAEPLIPRGAIGAMCIELLTGSDEPYAEIVAKIVARYPTAKTTARSLASVAMDLRRDGVQVPSRCKPAAPKIVPAQ